MRDLNSPDQGSNPRPLQWKCRILTTGPPGKSPLRVLDRDMPWSQTWSWNIFLAEVWDGDLPKVLRPHCPQPCCPVRELSMCSVHSLESDNPHLVCKPGAAFPMHWFCQLPPIFFLSSQLQFHLYYYFGDHDFRSSQGHALSRDQSGSHTIASNLLGMVGGQEGGITRRWWICRLWWWFYFVCTCQNLPNCTF